MLKRWADVFGSFALVVLVFRLTAPASTSASAWPAWRAAAPSLTGSGSMSSTVMAGIVLLGAGAVRFARAPTAKMRTDPPLALALGGAGA